MIRFALNVTVIVDLALFSVIGCLLADSMWPALLGGALVLVWVLLRGIGRAS